MLVRKKDGKVRVCVDYRKINTITKADQYPIPRIDDIFTFLSGKRWFSTFDANKGFHQVQMQEDSDKEKTAFRSHVGLKQYTRMPFGLKNGPAVFQRTMDKVLGKHKWCIALVYIDDLIVASDTFEQHLEDCATILGLVREAGISLSLTKAHLGYQEIQSLGHKISSLGLATLEEKVRAVREWKTPENAKEVQRFLGLATYYRKFVKDFSTIAKPLTKLLRKDAPFTWQEAERTAFNDLKRALTEAPVLVQPDFTKPFKLYTDASRVGLGVILAQVQDEGEERVILYLSRQLKPEERNYAATELECLAIVWALKKLHAYLDGSKLELFTDHSALQWLYDFKGSNNRILRWALEVQPYRDNMKIVHRKGTLHDNVDALSREPMQVNAMITTVTPSTAIEDQIRTGYAADAYFTIIMNELKNDQHEGSDVMSKKSSPFIVTDGLMYRTDACGGAPRLCIPDAPGVRLKLLKELHDAPMAGHFGYRKTLDLIQARYFWPRMASDVKRYVASCDDCQRNKSTNQPPSGLLRPLEIPKGRWQEIAMDFITGLPTTVSGYDCILVVVDRLTKRVHLSPTCATASAPDVAKLFIRDIVRLHGVPRVIVSDRDTRFTSRFWTSLFEQLGTKLALSTAFHPQTDGQTERTNRTIGQTLRHYVAHNQADWETVLPLLEFALNNATSASTGFSPFLLDLGYQPTMPSDLGTRVARHDNEATDDFVRTMQRNLQTAKDAILLAQNEQAAYYNDAHKHVTFAVGDRVMLDARNHSTTATKQVCKKLGPRYIGPFCIISKVSDHAYHLDLPANARMHPVVNVSYLKRYQQSPLEFLPRTNNERAPPVSDDGGQEWEVERILQERGRGKRKSYLVKWLSYPEYDSTWEPLQNLVHAKGKIREFQKTRIARAGTALLSARGKL